MDKVLLIDKPREWTSFDVVAKVRSTLRGAEQGPRPKGSPKVRVGHAGTLDPLATGLLVVLVGKATKQQDSYMKQDKIYEVELKLGQTSTTADEEGEKTLVSSIEPSKADVEKAVKSFVGEISQIPPVFSAIKVDGQRAYKLARAGKPVEMRPRKVTIYSIEQIEYEYPKVTFTAKVSSGTYIRTLATDIGDKLNTGAYMSNLRRTQIGEFSITNAITVDDIPGALATPVE